MPYPASSQLDLAWLGSGVDECTNACQNKCTAKINCKPTLIVIINK
jgi:hypothetical protein